LATQAARLWQRRAPRSGRGRRRAEAGQQGAGGRRRRGRREAGRWRRARGSNRLEPVCTGALAGPSIASSRRGAVHREVRGGGARGGRGGGQSWASAGRARRTGVRARPSCGSLAALRRRWHVFFCCHIGEKRPTTPPAPPSIIRPWPAAATTRDKMRSKIVV